MAGETFSGSSPLGGITSDSGERKLPPADPIARLTYKRPGLSMAAIVRDWLVIVGVAALSIRVGHWAFYVAAVWVIGFFQFALSEAMLHEAAHYNLFRRRWLNHAMEIFYGLPFFRTVTQYQPEHRIHHTRLGGSDDELTNDYRRLGLYKSDVNMFTVWILKPLVGFGAYYVTILTLRPWREGAKIISFWALVLWIFFEFGMLHLLLYYWFIPLIWPNYAFVYWSEVENHYNTCSGTRTRANRLYNLVAHNGGYHAVHHKYPAVPWFNLPRAHAIAFPNCEDVSTSFLETYKQLRSTITSPRVPAFVRPGPSTIGSPEAAR